jgi:hypothetical protein
VTIDPGIAGSNCSAVQSSALQKAIDRALDQGMTCVGKLNPLIVTAALSYLQNHHIDVICGGSQPGTCGDYQIGGNGDAVIRIFADQTGCGRLEGIVFHEILHARLLEVSFRGLSTGDVLRLFEELLRRPADLCGPLRHRSGLGSVRVLVRRDLWACSQQELPIGFSGLEQLS